MYAKINEIFFYSFPIKLYKWIAKLADGQGRWKLNSPIVWTLELVRRLEASEDKIVSTVGRWLDHIKGGFVVEFTVDISVSYSGAERHFFKGP